MTFVEWFNHINNWLIIHKQISEHVLLINKNHEQVSTCAKNIVHLHAGIALYPGKLISNGFAVFMFFVVAPSYKVKPIQCKTVLGNTNDKFDVCE